MPRSVRRAFLGAVVLHAAVFWLPVLSEAPAWEKRTVAVTVRTPAASPVDPAPPSKERPRGPALPSAPPAQPQGTSAEPPMAPSEPSKVPPDPLLPVAEPGAGGLPEEVRPSLGTGPAEAGPAAPAAPVPGPDPVELRLWFDAVRTRVDEAKAYPYAARVRGIQGRVTVSFSVDAGGRLAGAAVVTDPSGSGVLDRAALEAVRSAVPFPAPPGGQGPGPWPFTLTVEFRLR